MQSKKEDLPATKNEPIDLTKDGIDCIAAPAVTKDDIDYLSVPAMTEEERKGLLQITNDLMKTKSSRRLRESLKNNFTYSEEIKETLDLESLKRKLINRAYASVQQYKRDFQLLIDNALQWHKSDTVIATDVFDLQVKFEEKMLSLAYLGDSEFETASDSPRSPSPHNGSSGGPTKRTRELPSRAAKRRVHTYRDPAHGDIL